MDRPSNSARFFRRIIYPAIRGQTCPICLKSLEGEIRSPVAVIRGCLHAYCEGCISRWSQLKRRCPLCNARFDSWFHRISLASHTFQVQKLPSEGKAVNTPPAPRNTGTRITTTMIQRRREEVDGGSRWRRTQPLPRRRTFGRPPPWRTGGSVPSEEEIGERKLGWRASVYERGLRAVPLSLSSGSGLRQNLSKDGWSKEKMLRRIEAWIKRELQALLEDPDPSIVVHVASSLFIANACLEGGIKDDFLAPLRPFLGNRTDAFWHELTCFAESSLGIETYDSVVEYTPSN